MNRPIRNRIKIPMPSAIFGSIIGALTLIFLLILVLVPSENTCARARPLSVVVALGLALSIAFIGGDASLRGKLPVLWLRSKPLAIATVGGVAAFLIVLLIGNQVLSCRTEQPIQISWV